MTLPFSVNIDGTTYTTDTISTNGVRTFGKTAGSARFSSNALPTPSFSAPTLFWYGDDWVTEGNHIRYGTVGTAPSAFIVDFQTRLFSDSVQKMNWQVQIHETLNTISVKYRDPLSPNGNDQSATVGLQGAGGSSARARPLVFNGKVLDDNRPHSGWSVAPLPT